MFLWSEVKTLIIVPHTQATPPQQTIRMIKVIVEIISKTLLCQFPHYVIAFSKQGIFFYTTFIDQVTDAYCCWTGSQYMKNTRHVFKCNFSYKQDSAEHIPLLSSSFNDLLRSSNDQKKLCKQRTHVIHSKYKRQVNDKPNMSVSKVHSIYVLYGSTMGHHQLVLFLGRQFNSILVTH